jgi:hypothetical protein
MALIHTTLYRFLRFHSTNHKMKEIPLPISKTAAKNNNSCINHKVSAKLLSIPYRDSKISHIKTLTMEAEEEDSNLLTIQAVVVNLDTTQSPHPSSKAEEQEILSPKVQDTTMEVAASVDQAETKEASLLETDTITVINTLTTTTIE